MSETVEIKLVGGFEVHIGDRVVHASDFERRSGAELVQLLALSPRRRLHREQLIDALWPSASLDSAANRLHKAATYARKALDVDDSVVLAGDLVQLLPDVAVSVDVDTIAEAAKAQSPTDAGRALEMCTGELLPEARYEEWIVGPREAQRRHHLSLLETAERWRDLIEIDPVNEGAYLRLMSEAVQYGDRTEALSLYRALESALETHLSVAPSEAASRLREEAEQMDALSYSASGLGGNKAQRPDIEIVGREQDRLEIQESLADARLLTIVGAGGSGKTLLARHIAADTRDHFRSGSWIAEFGTVRDEGSVAQELLTAIGGQRHADASVDESIVRTLAPLSAMIVFDNCEQFVPTIANLALAVLDACPDVQILATSREPLGLPGEIVRPLHALDRIAAVELFCSRAREQGVVLAPDDPAIGAICRRLDDLPLAVELAAARTRSLSPAEIESLLDERFTYLQSSGIPAREHHQTLGEAIAWSIDALDPDLFDMICELSVFADTFSLTAARAVVDIAGQPGSAVPDRLDALVKRSVLQHVDVDGQSAFRMLESVRLYVRGLRPTKEASDRHLAYVLERFSDLESSGGAEPTRVIASFDREWDDIRAAFGHALSSQRREDAVRLVAACSVYALMTMRFELLDWAETIFPGDVDPATLDEARATAGWAALLSYRSDYPRGEALASLALSIAPGDDLALTALAWSRAAAGDLAEARDLLATIVDKGAAEPTLLGANARVLRAIFSVVDGGDGATEVEDLKVFASGGDDVYRMAQEFVMGCSQMRVAPDEAMASLAVSMQRSDRLGMDMSSIANRSLIAIGSALTGTIGDALVAVREALSWAAERGMWSSTLNDFTTAAIVLDRAGRPDVSICLLAVRHHSGFASGFGTARTDLTTRFRRADARQFDDAWQRGERLDARSATTYALRTIDELLRVPGPT